MKHIQLTIIGAFFLILISCSKDDEATSNTDCGKESNALCYAHNWDEFAMLNDLVQGDAVYSHVYSNTSGSSSFTYKVSLNNVCPKATLEIDLSNIVNFGIPVLYLSTVYINGEDKSVVMDNINGIITGHFHKVLDGTPVSTINIYNTIIIPNDLKDPAKILEFDMNWYNTNVSSHGITAKFQNPK